LKNYINCYYPEKNIFKWIKILKFVKIVIVVEGVKVKKVESVCSVLETGWNQFCFTISG
jgi:hypothetical protein